MTTFGVAGSHCPVRLVLREDVTLRCPRPPSLQRRHERRLINHLATRGVDDQPGRAGEQRLAEQKREGVLSNQRPYICQERGKSSGAGQGAREEAQIMPWQAAVSGSAIGGIQGNDHWGQSALSGQQIG